MYLVACACCPAGERGYTEVGRSIAGARVGGREGDLLPTAIGDSLGAMVKN